MPVAVTSIHYKLADILGQEPVSAAIAAAASLSFCGGWLPDLRRALATIAPQQYPPVLLPLLRQRSGASLVCRRFLWRKIRNAVALPLFPAAHVGDNFANIDTFVQRLSPINNRHKWILTV